MPLLPVAFFALGAIIASFVGVVVARLNTGESFLTGRSRCDVCNEPLGATSLIPILSYLSSGGRSRCCGAQLPLVSIASELVLGGLFVGAYTVLGTTLALAPMLVSFALLLALVLYDLAHQILPPVLLGAFIALSTLTGFLGAPSGDAFLRMLLTAFLIACSLLIIHYISRGRAMGFSDAPLAFGLALMVGGAALSGFIFSFWIGAVIGLFVLAGRPVGSRMGVEVPFAPFLAAGFLLAYFTQWNPFVYLAALPR